MRACPFCDSMRLQVVEKMQGKGTTRRFAAYVRCRKCGARGPLTYGLEYDVRNERPSMGASQLQREAAVKAWDAEKGDESDFKLEEDRL